MKLYLVVSVLRVAEDLAGPSGVSSVMVARSVDLARQFARGIRKRGGKVRIEPVEIQEARAR